MKKSERVLQHPSRSRVGFIFCVVSGVSSSDFVVTSVQAMVIGCIYRLREINL